MARARILVLERDRQDEAIALANDVLADDDAPTLHKAWARYVQGLVAFHRGAIGEAYRHARAASEPELRVDEMLVVSTAQLLLALERTEDAKHVLKRLSSGPSADLFTRAHVIAWWYAQSGDMRAGLATLSGAGYGPDKEAAPPFRAFVLAELLSSSPRADERTRAIELYRRTLGDSDWGVLAAHALAGILLEDGEDEQAIEVLQTALAAHPSHLTLVDRAAQAWIASDRLADAEKVTATALETFDDEGWAHGSHARVLLGKGSSAEALAALDRAVELSPDDARLYALRGDAARAMGSTGPAKESYERALQLNPAEPRALSGFAALLIDSDDFTRAAEIIEQMDQFKVHDLRADSERVRYLIRTGAGQSGMTSMRAAVARHSKNVPLRLAGARVCLQAEDYPRAMSYFQLAKRHGADARLADTGLALAQVYGRRKLGAENSLERATQAVDVEGNPLSANPQVQVWELVVKAHFALADEKRGLAVRYAKQAATIRPDDPDLALLQADIEEDRERSPESALRRAIAAKEPMPVALGRLALLLGPTDEGCELVSRYLRANRGGRQARKTRRLREQCGSDE